jgi:integrase
MQMKNRYWLFKRGTVYYLQDALSGKQESLGTRDPHEAERLRQAKNEATQNRTLSLALARAYLSAHDPQMGKRIWEDVMKELSTHGREPSQIRCRREIRSQPFNLIRQKPLVETNGGDLLAVLRMGTVSTNHYLRRLHNLAVGLGWLAWPILAPKLWPRIQSKPKRAIRWEEHNKITTTESNLERRLYYELLWETGASQSDAATLTSENVDWASHTIAYHRHKTGQLACLTIGVRLEKILQQLPSQGCLFPYWSRCRDTDRSNEFRRRCRILGIQGVTLHSYRYAWAERAKASGYPERWAQAALGHDSRAVHEAYAKEAFVVCPPLEDYEDKIVELQTARGQISKTNRSHMERSKNLVRRFPNIALAASH